MRTLMTIFIFVIMVAELVVATKPQPAGRWGQNNKGRTRPGIGHDLDGKDRGEEFDQGRGHDSGIKGSNERRPNFGDHGCDGRGHGRDSFDDSSYPREIGSRNQGKDDYGRSGVRGSYGDQGSRSGGYEGSRSDGYGGSRSGNFEKTRSGGYGGSRTGSYGGSRSGTYGYANKRYGA